MTYAVISLGGKQHRVQEGERLIVDRLPTGEGKTFHPRILLAGGDGQTVLSPTDVQVTARVVKHDLGPKVRIGKYKPKKGYKRHNGHRSRITQIEIESIGAKAARKTTKKDEATD
jgi:large subunit ribosomal protein L21